MIRSFLSAILLLASVPAFAQGDGTKALVNVVIAEKYCGLDAPQSTVVALGERSRAETGLDVEQTVQAVYGAASELGEYYAQQGALGTFCKRMGQIYGSLR